MYFEMEKKMEERKTEIKNLIIIQPFRHSLFYDASPPPIISFRLVFADAPGAGF